MAIAALVVSILALVLAGASAVYTRIQAVESRELRRIEAARRHEERAPRLAGEAEAVNDGSWHRLWLRLETPTPLTRLEVHIVESNDVTFTPGTNGVEAMPLDRAAPKPIDAVYNLPNPLTQGQKYSWAIEFDREKGTGRFCLRVVCHGADDVGAPVTWTTLIEVPPVPPFVGPILLTALGERGPEPDGTHGCSCW